MRILHVSPSYIPAYRFGGPVQSVHLLNKALVQRGLQVRVLTTCAGISQKDMPPMKVWLTVDQVSVIYMPYWGYEHYTFSWSLFWKLQKFIPESDVVHITAVWNFTVWAAYFWCRWHNKPYIVSPRGTLYPETIALGRSRLKKLYYEWVAKKCLAHAHAIHYTTKDEMVRVNNYLGIKTPGFVIPNGLELQVIEESGTSKKFEDYFPRIAGHPYILFLGRIHIKKGLDVLLQAFALFQMDHPEYGLVIAGPDDSGYSATLHTLSQKLNIHQKIFFCGEVHGAQKTLAYKNATCFVLTSYSENFGMSVVEALATKCPVVISEKVALCDDICAHQAGLVVSLNAEKIAKAIADIADKRIDIESLTQNGVKLLQDKYDIKTVAAQMENLYTNCMLNKL